MIRISLTFIFSSIVVGFALMPNSIKLFYQFVKDNYQIERPQEISIDLVHEVKAYHKNLR